MEAVWRFESFALTFDGFAVIYKPYPAKYRLPFISYDKSGTLLSDSHKRMPERGQVHTHIEQGITADMHVLIWEGIEDCRDGHAHNSINYFIGLGKIIFQGL